MRNRFQKVFLMATLLLCSSYGVSQESKSTRKTVMAAKNTIKVSDFGKKYDFYDVIKDIEFVPLEMTDESIVGSVSNIQFYKNFILFYDNQTRSIFIFDDKGKYIRKISRVGKGPGEYNDINDFCVHPQTGMITIATDSRKIITYSFDLKEFKEYTDVPYAIAIAQFKNGSYAITSTQKEANLYILDANMNVLHKGLANPLQYTGVSNSSFTKLGDTFLCRLPTYYNDTIYQVTPNSFRPWRVPDFEGHPDYSNPT
ncbi:MAG: 6-bladed beta-propeller [Bacteroidales bacterium]|nr:6-bladed beta-propeller [Bacteroidales bacterium]